MLQYTLSHDNFAKNEQLKNQTDKTDMKVSCGPFAVLLKTDQTKTLGTNITN